MLVVTVMAAVGSKNVGSSFTSSNPKVIAPVSCPTCTLRALMTLTVPVISCAKTLTVALGALILNSGLWKVPPVTLIVPGKGDDKVMPPGATKVPPVPLMASLFDDAARFRPLALDMVPALVRELDAVSVRLRLLAGLVNPARPPLGMTVLMRAPWLLMMLAALSPTDVNPVVEMAKSEPKFTRVPVMVNVGMFVKLRTTSTFAGMVSECSCDRPRVTTPPSAAPSVLRSINCFPEERTW